MFGFLAKKSIKYLVSLAVIALVAVNMAALQKVVKVVDSSKLSSLEFGVETKDDTEGSHDDFIINKLVFFNFDELNLAFQDSYEIIVISQNYHQFSSRSPPQAV